METLLGKVMHFGMAGINEIVRLGGEDSLPEAALRVIDSAGGSQPFSLPLLPEVEPYHHSKDMLSGAYSFNFIRG